MPMSDRNRSCAACHIVVLAGLFLLAFTRPSHAYVDPGSVSIIITAILGALAAIGYTVRRYWGRFKSLLAQMKATLKGDKREQDGK